MGRQPRGRRKKREPGRGHYDKDRPAIIAWVSRQGGVVIHATRDFTVKTVQKAADLAIQAGSKLYTDSASSYRLITGYAHDAVNHTRKEYARGDVHENRAESLFSLLKPYLRVFRGISKCNLPGYVGFCYSRSDSIGFRGWWKICVSNRMIPPLALYCVWSKQHRMGSQRHGTIPRKEYLCAVRE